MPRPFRLDPKTHLGDPQRKRVLTAQLFETVAPRYDAVTRYLSFGRDRVWKDRLIAMLPSLPGPACLDIACGTGDLTRRLAARYPDGHILGLDRAPAMMARARRQTAAPQVRYALGDMGRSGLDTAAFDVVTGGYALRNAGLLDEAIAETYRVLKPGGVAAFLDFSKPPRRACQQLELRLLKGWGGFWGWALHGNPDVYGYIADSLADYPDRIALAARYRAAGYTVQRARRFCFGMIEAVLLRKPDPAQTPGGEP